ncbi:hypothetical protein B1R94_27620 [Mycolicibacterium litorale]|nr:hypothetical protein B1R94_27620 [Mycolicibacterium litorale]
MLPGGGVIGDWGQCWVAAAPLWVAPAGGGVIGDDAHCSGVDGEPVGPAGRTSPVGVTTWVCSGSSYRWPGTTVVVSTGTR